MRRSGSVEQAIEAWLCPLQTYLDLILMLPTCDNFSPFPTNITPFALLSHILLTPQSQQGMGNTLWCNKHKLPVLNQQDLQDTPLIRPDVPHQPQSGLQWRQPPLLWPNQHINYQWCIIICQFSLPPYSAQSCNPDNLLLLCVVGSLQMLTSVPLCRAVPAT